MYTESTPGGPAGPGTGGPKRPRQPQKRSSKPASSHKGFFIVLLVLLVLAAAAAVVFFWYLPSRSSDPVVDPEGSAKTLMSQAMTAIEKAYEQTGTFDPQVMNAAILSPIAPEIGFQPVSSTAAATSPTSSATIKAVDYAGTETNYDVGTVSENGTAYGVIVEMEGGKLLTYYLNGQPVDSWDLPTTTLPTTDPSPDSTSSDDPSATSTSTPDPSATTSETAPLPAPMTSGPQI